MAHISATLDFNNSVEKDVESTMKIHASHAFHWQFTALHQE